MLLNGRTSENSLLFCGFACHNTKQSRRRVKKAIKSKAKAAFRREIRG